ncbi:hypothetical protein BABINDRAFT_160353 [Babjeviella inositovora NRRL Y-12698]|uniref:Uncharacterized protein n=1 Tax=Babjeviella inositovora NRRL Y-12698 TaxID=984486 RepID=A0A1E3QT99_9ASCO|nr:uncharacterized protein BABINDRAFT_160353 [Babjeviella inositovora NRRL Y-12698]ODQ80911.1 hypothetical protein BABINDRAFT_160353 [Babjeviella inositovora NRRL Y-12698]
MFSRYVNQSFREILAIWSITPHRHFQNTLSEVKSIQLPSKMVLNALAGQYNQKLNLIAEIAKVKISKKSGKDTSIELKGGAAALDKATALIEARLELLKNCSQTLELTSATIRSLLGGKNIIAGIEIATDTNISVAAPVTDGRQVLYIFADDESKAHKAKKRLLEGAALLVVSVIKSDRSPVLFRAFLAEIEGIKASHKVTITTDGLILVMGASQTGVDAARDKIIALLRILEAKTIAFKVESDLAVVIATSKGVLAALEKKYAAVVSMNRSHTVTEVTIYSPDALQCQAEFQSLLDLLKASSKQIHIPSELSHAIYPRLAAIERKTKSILKMRGTERVQLHIYALDPSHVQGAYGLVTSVVQQLADSSVYVAFDPAYFHMILRNLSWFESIQNTNINLSKTKDLLRIYSTVGDISETVTYVEEYGRKLSEHSRKLQVHHESFLKFAGKGFLRVNDLERDYNVKVNYKKERNKPWSLPSGNGEFGEVHVIGDSASQVQSALEKIHACLAPIFEKLKYTVYREFRFCEENLPYELLFRHQKFRYLLDRIEKSNQSLVKRIGASYSILSTSESHMDRCLDAIEDMFSKYATNMESLQVPRNVFSDPDYSLLMRRIERNNNCVLIPREQEISPSFVTLEVYHKDCFQVLVAMDKLRSYVKLKEETRAVGKTHTLTLQNLLLPLLTHDGDTKLRQLEKLAGVSASSGEGCKFRIYRFSKTKTQTGNFILEISAPDDERLSKAVHILEKFRMTYTSGEKNVIGSTISQDRYNYFRSNRVTPTGCLSLYNLRSVEQETGATIYIDDHPNHREYLVTVMGGERAEEALNAVKGAT